MHFNKHSSAGQMTRLSPRFRRSRVMVEHFRRSLLSSEHLPEKGDRGDVGFALLVKLNRLIFLKK